MGGSFFDRIAFVSLTLRERRQSFLAPASRAMHQRPSTHPVYPRQRVESPIESQNTGDAVVHHDGHVEGVSGRSGDAPVQHYRRTLHVPLLDRVHLINHTEKCVERRLNGVPSFDRDVTMEDLLKNLGARDKTFVIGDGPLKELLSVDLVGMRGSNEVHGHV